jgi:hypothetical protein
MSLLFFKAFIFIVASQFEPTMQFLFGGLNAKNPPQN